MIFLTPQVTQNPKIQAKECGYNYLTAYECAQTLCICLMWMQEAVYFLFRSVSNNSKIPVTNTMVYVISTQELGHTNNINNPPTITNRSLPSANRAGWHQKNDEIDFQGQFWRQLGQRCIDNSLTAPPSLPPAVLYHHKQLLCYVLPLR
jgi:hypothetical protein